MAATQYWHASFSRPLKIVAGEERLATATTFYSPDAPSYLILDDVQYTPWVSLEQVKRDGLLVICPAEEESCLRSAITAAGEEAPRFHYQAEPRFLGRTGKPQSFVFIVRPPENIAGVDTR